MNFIYNPNNEKTHYVGVSAVQDNTGQYNGFGIIAALSSFLKIHIFKHLP